MLHVGRNTDQSPRQRCSPSLPRAPWLRSRSHLFPLGAGVRAITNCRDRFPADDGLPKNRLKHAPCSERYEEQPASLKQRPCSSAIVLARVLGTRSGDIALSACMVAASNRVLPSHYRAACCILPFAYIPQAHPSSSHDATHLSLPGRCLIYKKAMQIVFALPQCPFFDACHFRPGKSLL